MTPILPGQTIGMLGGGQLGRMSTFKAKQMGYTVVTLDPAPHSPCGQVADAQLIAGYTDHLSLIELSQRCDVVTYEFENVPSESVELIVGHGKPVFPAASVLNVTQNRVREKTFVRQLGLNVADFWGVQDRADLEQAIDQIGFPAILKTAGGGYDGKGQFVIGTADEAVRAFEASGGVELIWERQVPFDLELSVICARNQQGEVVAYSPTENIHVNNILDISIAPGRVSPEVQAEAQRVACEVAAGLGLVGVCGVEMFLLPDETLLVNEIAPRPHNSGHHTIESCICSQFEQHIRAVCGLPLGSTELISPAVMVNILGSGTGNRLAGVPDVLRMPNVHFHLYGKREAKASRKMGHLTVLAADVETAFEIALAARQQLRWE